MSLSRIAPTSAVQIPLDAAGTPDGTFVGNSTVTYHLAVLARPAPAGCDPAESRLPTALYTFTFLFKEFRCLPNVYPHTTVAVADSGSASVRASVLASGFGSVFNLTPNLTPVRRSHRR